jgi:Protein of unknown function (DUF3752)
MIGPTLPSHLQKRREETTEEDENVVNGRDPSASPPPKSAVTGPQLPPHLQRKKQKTTKEKDESEIVAQSTAPSPPSRRTVTGPQLPPHLLAAREAKRKRKLEEESTPNELQVPSPPSPKRHIFKPSTPPEDSDSDTEVGPSLSAMMTPAETTEYTLKTAIERLSRAPPPPKGEKPENKVQRDGWMLAPPTRADWLGSLDASKLKSRTFNQSKSGTNASGKAVDHSIWTETPLERAARVEEEVLGKKKSVAGTEVEDERTRVEATERDRRIKEYNARTRGPSLMEKYASSGKDVGDDDPSKRAFDYEKDIAGGRTLGFKERDAMIGRAKNLDSKYSGGNYL